MDERLDAALALDAVGETSPDQRLLRVLLRDGRRDFERALNERLVENRAGAGEDAPPRSLLPLGTIALAALAVQVHRWDLQIESACLPGSLLNVPARLLLERTPSCGACQSRGYLWVVGTELGESAELGPADHC